MPDYVAPGVFIEEVPPGPPRIEGLSTSVAGFVGPTLTAPTEGALPLLRSYADFENVYGGQPGDLTYAVRGYFENGGRRLYVARVGENATYPTALAALAEIAEISIVAAPGSSRGGGDAALAVGQLLVEHCERMPHRFAVIDSPDGVTPGAVLAHRAQLDSSRAAYYYPWIEVVDPTSGRRCTTPPSGFVAGIYARNDIERGVHMPPVNTEVRSAVGLERVLDRGEQERLNPEGVNCLRQFEDRGFVVWGARTLSSDPEWKYVNLRRYLAYLEHSIDQGTQWARFEPNGEPLWLDLRRSVEAFLYAEFRAGHLMGSTAEDAFFVRCDRSTMTQNDLDNGRLVCLVGVAAIRPAEFVIFRIGQMTTG